MADDVYPVIALLDSGIQPAALPAAAVLDGINLSGAGAASDISDASSAHGSLMATSILREAPQARFLVVKVLDSRGWLSEPARLDEAFEWLCEARRRWRLALVCAAFADLSQLTHDDSLRASALCHHVAALRSSGIPTVVPAGNGYARFRLCQPSGMAWPAVLRETVSVGALVRVGDGVALHPSSQRLHARAGSACATTVFALPGAPGETSGAAAVVAGRLSRVAQERPGASVDALLAQLLRSRATPHDENGWAFPMLEALG